MTRRVRRQTARKRFDLAMQGGCFFCGESRYAALQAHRLHHGADGGRYDWSNTLTVCASCHCLIHAGLIVLDPRRYPSTMGPMLHFWIDGVERWEKRP